MAGKKKGKKPGKRARKGASKRTARRDAAAIPPTMASAPNVLASLGPVPSTAAIIAAFGDASATCQFTFKIGPDNDGPDFHRAAYVDTESDPLVFDGDEATGEVSAGPHMLVWTVAGQPGEGFSFELTGEIDRKHAGGGSIPPARVTSGVINFVAESK